MLWPLQNMCSYPSCFKFGISLCASSSGIHAVFTTRVNANKISRKTFVNSFFSECIRHFTFSPKQGRKLSRSFLLKMLKTDSRQPYLQLYRVWKGLGRAHMKERSRLPCKPVNSDPQAPRGRFFNSCIRVELIQ